MTVYDATSIEAELKPCPFCGSEQVTAAPGFAEFEDDPDWVVICKACGSAAPGKTEAEAVAAWNIRALPVSPVPTTGEASEPSPLSERPRNAGVGHAPGSATDGGSDAIGETVEKLREAATAMLRYHESGGHVGDADAVEANLRTALEQRGDGWLPIESAPKDGTYVLIATERHDGGMLTAMFDADWGADGWWLLDDGKNPEIPLRGPAPTHWRPLPTPPLPMKED